MKPRRVVMTFGTNDTGMEVSDFIAHYTALIQAIQQSYPYTDIIVNTVPPVPADHSNYPDVYKRQTLYSIAQISIFSNSNKTLFRLLYIFLGSPAPESKNRPPIAGGQSHFDISSRWWCSSPSRGSRGCWR